MPQHTTIPLSGAFRRRFQLSDAQLFACAATLLGSLDALLLIGGGQINPGNLSWLKGDAAVYQAGWEFLRREPWHFPPTWISRLDYPFGISAAYLDVIPIVAVPLRLISGVLPANFQYLGLYAALCLVLQAYYGFRLISLFSTDRLTIFIGGLFFLNSPILLNRLFGHFSLCSQWLLLASLYYYFCPTTNRKIYCYLAPFAALLAISAAISPYITVMVFVIALCALFRAGDRGSLNLGDHQDSHRDTESGDDSVRSLSARFLWLAAFAGLAVGSFAFFGFITFGAGAEMQGSGYTQYSMNLLAPFNPSGPSLYFKSLDVMRLQAFEGYNYLGMGVILLYTVILARRPQLITLLWTPTVRPLVFASVALTMLALSTRIAFGETVLLDLPAPKPLLHLLDIFRSSGRFFWPVHDLLFLGATVGVLFTIPSRRIGQLVIAAAFVLQFMDTLPLREAVASQIQSSISNPLAAEDWVATARTHKHLVILPARQCDPDHTPGGDEIWPWFARLVARNGLTLNSVHAARTSAASEAFNCSIEPEKVLRGDLDQHTAYVLGARLALQLAGKNGTGYFCRTVDTFELCTYDPARARLSGILADSILPFYRWGTEFRADRPPPPSMLLDGWDLRPFPATWSTGNVAYLYIRPLLPPNGDVRRAMIFGGNGALLTPHHALQRAFIRVNGHLVGTLRFTYRGQNRQRSVVIARRFMGAGQVVEITFDLPDAESPLDLGINQDGRMLGIYVARIRLVDNQ